MTHRAWMFTLFGEVFDILDRIGELQNDPEVLFMTGQLETCPTTARVHFQGYVEFTKPCRMPAAKQRLDPRLNVHVEPRVGTREQAIAYCNKEETRLEGYPIYAVDHRRPQGAAGVWAEIADMVGAGASDGMIAAEHPAHYARNYAGIHALRQALFPERTKPPLVIWFHGPAGCGKSRLCQTLSSRHTVYWKTPDKWWPSYRQQDIVILDEIDPTWMDLRMLFRVLDRYPLTLEVKGGHVPISSPVVLVTSDGAPSPKMQCDLVTNDQLLRRLDMVIEFERHVTAAGVRWKLMTTRFRAMIQVQVSEHEVQEIVDSAVARWKDAALPEIDEDLVE